MNEFYLLLPEQDKAELANIRHWANLKIAFDGADIWVKDFDMAQINALEVKSLSSKSIFYAQNGKLFPQNSRLPDRNIPSLLWTAIDRALTIEFPPFNHNFFGIVDEKIEMQLVAEEQEVAATVMLTSVEQLKNHLETAPSVRLRHLSWVVLNSEKAVIFGAPLLPIAGDVFWQNDDFIIPAGYNFEWRILAPSFNKVINPDSGNLVFWNADNTYCLIPKSNIEALSLGSFRRTFDIQLTGKS